MNRSPVRRQDRLILERNHDSYRERHKHPDRTACPDCGAVFLGGSWGWASAPADATSAVCPACRRVADRFPAGFVELSGEFFREHRSEILNLVKNLGAAETRLHPLERIMMLTTGSTRASITTTGIHIARRIGEAVNRSYSGELNVQYGDGESSVQVQWKRDT